MRKATHKYIQENTELKFEREQSGRQLSRLQKRLRELEEFKNALKDATPVEKEASRTVSVPPVEIRE